MKLLLHLFLLLSFWQCSSLSSPTATKKSSPFSESSIIRVPWLIVGGGIHGVHVATRLLGEGVTDDLCIVDDANVLLSKWKKRTAATGMEYLRSSSGYHLDLSEDSLRNFGSGAATKDALFSKDYQRPRLDLFNRHCDAVIDQYELNSKHVQGKVIQLEPHDDHVKVQIACPCNSCSGPTTNTATKTATTKNIQVMADQVVLALGSDKPSYPEWATQDLVDSGMIQHLLDTDTITEAIKDAKSVAIVGGGITAGHKALQLAQREGKMVHLISRHSIVEQQFDTHQDWMMDLAAAQRSLKGGGAGLPKRQKQFQSTHCWRERRQIIARERISGTVTAAVNRGANGLQYAIRRNLVQWHQTQVKSVESTNNDTCTLQLYTGESIKVDQILLATGFGKRPPSLLTQLESNSTTLPVSDFCGYPIVDQTLRWGHERIFVTGALAELELGPSARNIAGARLAAERILQASKRQEIVRALRG